MPYDGDWMDEEIPGGPDPPPPDPDPDPPPPPTGNCPGGYAWSDEHNMCLPLGPSCGAGFEWDGSSCIPTGENPNPPDENCEPPNYLNAHGQCVSPITNPNPNPPVTHTCEEGYLPYRITATGEQGCAIDPRHPRWQDRHNCPPGSTWNDARQACVHNNDGERPVTCTGGKVWDEATKRCVTPPEGPSPSPIPDLPGGGQTPGLPPWPAAPQVASNWLALERAIDQPETRAVRAPSWGSGLDPYAGWPPPPLPGFAALPAPLLPGPPTGTPPPGGGGGGGGAGPEYYFDEFGQTANPTPVV